jgi:type IV pilus assembly protein PilA
MNSRKGFTLIELMIVVAIIGILAAIAIPMYRTQTVKAKISEGVRGINTLASAIGDYYNEEAQFPGAMANVTQIFNTLGVGVVTTADDGDAKVQGVSIASGTGVITVVLQNCGDTAVDGVAGGLVLTPTVVAATDAIYWTWSGAIPQKYMPKK